MRPNLPIVPILPWMLLLFLGPASISLGQSKPGQVKQEQVPAGSSIPEPRKLPPMKLAFLDLPPVIDGNLDDPAWKTPPLQLGEWLTYNPSYGEKLAQKTEVWAVYDKNYLYFAFRCLDPEPGKIKTSIARRDTLWNDDWVGLSLDSLGSGQSTYDMFVNPSGIQADILTSSTAGENVSPDWVWDSAGRITPEGYTVEIRLPFKSIRFKSGANVPMAVLFWRRVSRLGVSASWPDLPRGQSIFTRHAPISMQDLKQPLTLEAIPNFTYSMLQARSAPGEWEDADSKADAGLTMKYGITSSITADGTIRPDFSQVESDAFQVEVNRRYPIFYSEKRPFFMEGMGTFELAGTGGDGNMSTAVHTRRIIDPLYGFKLTGSLGKFTFATLSASDRAPGQTDSSDPYFGERKSFNIGRLTYGLGKGSYVGALFTDTEFGDGHNRVMAGDVSKHIGEHQSLSATFIGTQTVSSDGTDSWKGMAGQSSYFYSSKRFEGGFQMEHFDRDFQMDTGFYNRTGITGGWIYSGVNFYPDQQRHPWFKKFNPFIFTRGYDDRIQGGFERIAVGGFRFNFTRQGRLQVNIVKGREPWAQQMFEVRSIEAMGGAQWFRWLNFQSNISFSRSTFYDPVNPFPGKEMVAGAGIILQPNSKLNQQVYFTRDVFERLSTGERVFAVNILNTRTTYQFNKRFAVRGIAQFDNSKARWLLDFLGSYELMPGTVAYAGYGALYERGGLDSQQLVRGSGAYFNNQRSLFFKVSYLHRF